MAVLPMQSTGICPLIHDSINGEYVRDADEPRLLHIPHANASSN